MTDSLITVMLVDDHAVVRTGYRMLLEMAGAFSVVAEVDAGDVAADQYTMWSPDVVVMDLNFPGISGIESTRRILQLDSDAKVLIFSIHDESIYISRAFDAGASGYLCKSCSPTEMVEAVRLVAAGKLYTDSNLSYIGMQAAGLNRSDPMQFLSTREFEVFQLFGKGFDSRDIAERLGVTAKTVSNYAILIKEKLTLGSTSELVRMATQFVSARQPSGQ
jgi:DNA-binding NarL/FixJ family response regulator